MKLLRLLACPFLVGGSFLSSAVQAQNLMMLDLFQGQTITVSDKRYSNWQLDDFELGNGAFGSLAEIFVTTLDDNPLNPGVKFNIPAEHRKGTVWTLEEIGMFLLRPQSSFRIPRSFLPT
jgi:hypothetical protein